MRGQLTEEIQGLAKGFLGRETTITELRLYPYFVMKNEQKIDPSQSRGKKNPSTTEEHIEGGASGLSMTKEFYDYINQVLWIGYVVNG